MNEYVIYWRREILFRSKVICETEEEAGANILENSKSSYFLEDIDEEGNEDMVAVIDNVEMLEENVDD
jgi:hypothetical protein